MTLRTNTLLIGGFTLIALIGVLYALSARFLMEGFALIEKQETTEGTQRGEQGVKNVMIHLNDNMAGWSQWDESVQFVQTYNPKLREKYVTQNLSEDILAQFKSDLILYVRNNGKVVFGTGFNRVSREREPLPADFLSYLEKHKTLLQHRDPQGRQHGIVLLSRGPLLLVSRPIVQNSGSGPSYGSLLCGRFLDGSEINDVIESLQLPLAIQRLDSPQLPEDFQRAYSQLRSLQLATPEAVYTSALNENNIAGYTLLEDIDHTPALLMRVETKRDIYQQGLISLRFILVALLSVGLIGGGLALWSLERFVLSRLSRLSRSVEQISSTGDISVRVPIVGNDELSKLAINVNKLLQTAEKGQLQLRGEIVERHSAERALLQSRDELESRVEERTTQYLETNAQLESELRERHLTEETLRQAQEMLKLVINHIPQAIFWKDCNSVFLGCNGHFAHNAGYGSPEMLVGLNDFDIYSGNAEAYRADDKEVIESDSAKLNIEEPLIKADGSLIWLRTNKIPLHDSAGTVVGVLGSYEDISLRKADEAALEQARKEADQANAAKSEFLSRMSHELRTPLNAILGFGQILEREELPLRAQEGVGYILKGGRHLLGLINEVLDIARVESGRFELSIEAVSLAEVIAESCDLIRPIAAEHNIRLEVNISSFASHYVLADQQRLKQVLINLLSNAIKYNSAAGKVTIAANVTPDDQIRIAVSDTGPGIAASDIGKLFIPFERLSAARSPIEGTGLGLALSQKLIMAMGGMLSVESVLGQGSSFFIHLPRATSPTEALVGIADNSAGLAIDVLQPTQPSHTVLYVEDNLSNLRLIELLLENRPEIKLISAMQGSIGLEMARQHVPDLILLDLNLPDLHGTAVLAELHRSPATCDIPVIVISADVTPGQIERLSQMGAMAYLGKPLDITEFVQTINQALRSQLIRGQALAGENIQSDTLEFP